MDVWPAAQLGGFARQLLCWAAGAAALYAPTFALMCANSRYQQTIMHRLKREQPLDDILHSVCPGWMAEHSFRRHTDTVVGVAPLLVAALAYHRGAPEGTTPVGWVASEEVGLKVAVLEFGALALYKQICCFSTRLTPATQRDNIRVVCGVPLSSWTDYGISGTRGG